MKKITVINVLVGIWLLIAPFAVASVAGGGPWTANDIVLGIVLIVASAVILSAARPAAGVAWFEVLCGIWLIIAPFLLRYANSSKAGSDVISGIIAIVIAAIALASMRQPPRVTA